MKRVLFDVLPPQSTDFGFWPESRAHRFRRSVGSVALGVFLLAAPVRFLRADIVAQNTDGMFTSVTAFFWGQSFTTTTAVPVNSITFSFFSDVPATMPAAAGTGFLLTMPYTGTPAALSSATPGFLGMATAAGGFWTLPSDVVLLAGTQYWFYENAPMIISGGSISYIGGNDYFTASSSTAYMNGVPNSANFRVTGTPVVPENSTTALFLSGSAVVFFAFRRVGRMA